MKHGIGVATMPGQENNQMAHCWLERDGYAYDTTWGAKEHVTNYRQGMKLSYVVEYSPLQWLTLYLSTNYPGPWDPKIKAICDRVKKRQRREN